MNRIIGLLFAVIPALCPAQDMITLHKVKHSDIFPLYTKEPKSSEYSAYLFTVGNEPLQPIGLRGANLEPYLKNHPVAYQTFLDYRTQTKSARTVSMIGSLSVGAGLAVLLATLDDDDVSDGVTYTSAGFVVTGFVINLFGRKSYRKARDTFEQSVDIYNNAN